MHDDQEVTGRSLAERRDNALACARTALAMLAERGIEACVVGSLARGDFDLQSDADFLVLSAVPVGDKMSIAAAIDHCFDDTDLSVDVTYADELDDRRYAYMTQHTLYLEDLS